MVCHQSCQLPAIDQIRFLEGDQELTCVIEAHVVPGSTCHRFRPVVKNGSLLHDIARHRKVQYVLPYILGGQEI